MLHLWFATLFNHNYFFYVASHDESADGCKPFPNFKEKIYKAITERITMRYIHFKAFVCHLLKHDLNITSYDPVLTCSFCIFTRIFTQ